MTLSDLSEQLGISKGQLSKLAARGMPTNDVEAARRWRKAHLDPSWAKPDQVPDVAPDPVAQVVARVIPLVFFRPDVIALAALDGGLLIDGEKALRLTVALFETYKHSIDTHFGDVGVYYDGNDFRGDPATRAAVITELDELIEEFKP